MQPEVRPALLSSNQPDSKRIEVHPKDIFSPQEVTLIQKLERGELPCPCCGQPLEGDRVVIEGVYEGILLSCPDVRCGYLEP